MQKIENRMPNRVLAVSILDDHTAFFQAKEAISKAEFSGASLDIRERESVLDGEIRPVPTARKVLFTTATTENVGQLKFLQLMADVHGYEVRQFHPADSFIVDPPTLGLPYDRGQRLMRFDGSISFALGHLAKRGHKAVVISDSFSLAEPLLRAAKISGVQQCLAFFGRFLDPRWSRFFREYGAEVHLLDFDLHSDAFFARRPQRDTNFRNGFSDDFLIRQ